MKKITKRIICAILVALMILSALPVSAFAALQPTESYQYYFVNVKERSPHAYARIPEDEYDRMWNQASLYYLKKIGSGTEYYAYCCDYFTSISSEEVYYKRISLEDCDYYTEEEAGKLRAIFKNGYHRGDGATELETLAEAAGVDTEINGPLTKGEALYATQLAVWLYGNKSDTDKPGNAGFPNAPYCVGSFFGTASMTFSKTTELFDSKGYVDNGENAGYTWYTSQKALANISAVYNYLIGLDGIDLDKEKIVFSDKYLVDWSLATISEADAKYDLTVFFGLETPVTDDDNVTLTVTNAGGDTLYTGALEANDDGYYSVTVQVDSTDDGVLNFRLTGTQELMEDVYLYRSRQDAYGNYEGQNFIGSSSGTTPIDAKMKVEYEIETDSVSLTKVNLDGGKKLADCAFDLYGEYVVDKGLETEHIVDIKFKEGLKTDSNGKIEVENLPDGLTYYFKEVAANENYIVVDPDRKYYVDENGTIEVANVQVEGNIIVTNTVRSTEKGYEEDEFNYTVSLDMSTAEITILRERLKKQDEERMNKENSISKKNGAVVIPEGTYATELWEDDQMIEEGEIVLDESTNFTGNFKLKDGQKFIIKKIPAGAGYSVEQDVLRPYKLTAPRNEEGSIPSKSAVQLDYLNVYSKNKPPKEEVNPTTGAPVMLPCTVAAVTGVYVANLVYNK